MRVITTSCKTVARFPCVLAGYGLPIGDYLESVMKYLLTALITALLMCIIFDYTITHYLVCFEDHSCKLDFKQDYYD